MSTTSSNTTTTTTTTTTKDENATMISDTTLPNNHPPTTLQHQESCESTASGGAGGLFHRPRTLYLVRHGEAVHNVLEGIAQSKAKELAMAQNLSPEETRQAMETARKAVLQDKTLRDAPLTEKGRQQVKDCALRLQTLLDTSSSSCSSTSTGGLHPPTEAIVSPLSRTLETCHILLNNLNSKIKAHIRCEIQERQTQYPPDTRRSLKSLIHYTEQQLAAMKYNIPTTGQEEQEQKQVPTDDDKQKQKQKEEESRFILDHILCSKEAIQQEEDIRNNYDCVDPQQQTTTTTATRRQEESKEMLRERAMNLFSLLVQMDHRHILIVSHKGYLRELERGLLGIDNSPLFKNAELRIYRVLFTRGTRELAYVERLA